MKFSKRRARHLDDYNLSAILCSVTLKTDCCSDKHEKHNKPEPELQLLDCSSRAYIHDFGSRRDRQLRKIDLLIGELQWLRRQTNKAWDKYDKFWVERKKE